MLGRIFSLSGRNTGRRGISALYLSGDKAKEQYAVLTPYMDIEEVMNKPDDLIENIFRRHLNTDVQKLYQRYALYVNTTEGKKALEKQREEIHRKISDKITSAEEKEKLVAVAKEARDGYKSLRDHAYGIESNFILQFLALPNAIHPRVPEGEDGEEIFSNIAKEQLKPTQNHLQLDAGRLVEFVDVTNCFFKGDVGWFDYQFPYYCCTEAFSEGFINFSNPDFVRTILVEGGRLEDKEKLFEVREDEYGSDNHLHLAGSGSMLSYLGFLTKLQIFPNILPMKLIATGKQYNKVGDTNPSLFNLTQSTSVQAFGIGKDESEALKIFDDFTKQLQDLNNRFGDLQFRMIMVPASQLTNSESLKVSIQMYSNHLQEFVEIGNVIYYGEYISKRLLFSYKEQKENRFPHLVSATVVDVAKLVGCRLENSSGQFSLPDFLR